MILCDMETCVGCRMCEVVCSSFHYGAVSPALSRIRVAKMEETGIDVAVACTGCLEKPCLECPTEALSVGEKGQILLDIPMCIDCEMCARACPIGAVGYYDGLPLFCDLCDGAVLCVEVCPTPALSYREDDRDASLGPFLYSAGSPNQKRARYAEVQAKPIREGWRNGRRVDS